MNSKFRGTIDFLTYLHDFVEQYRLHGFCWSERVVLEQLRSTTPYAASARGRNEKVAELRRMIVVLI